MIAVEIINTMIPSLNVTDDAHKALVWMEEFRCNYLPVVDNRCLLGFVSEEIIIQADDVEKEIGRFEVIGETCAVNLECHLDDILKIADQHNLKMVAVLNNKQEYEGVIRTQDVIAAFAQNITMQTPGGILVLSLNAIDYSLTEIGRLVEENNAKIFSSIVMEDEMDSNKIQLNLKINQLDLTHIIATLERFDYKIIGKYRDAHNQLEKNNDRIDMLMRYLNT